MQEALSLYQIIGVMVAMAGIVTGSSVFFLRKNTERMETSNKELFNAMKSSHVELKQDVKDLSRHLDERIDKMYDRLDMSSTELKEFVSQEVNQLKAKDNDQDNKLEVTRDKVNTINEEILKFKLEVSENYEKKGENHHHNQH